VQVLVFDVDGSVARRSRQLVRVGNQLRLRLISEVLVLVEEGVPRARFRDEERDLEVVWMRRCSGQRTARRDLDGRLVSPSTMTSLIPLFFVLFFLARSFSSRSLGRTRGRMLSMTRGRTGSLGLSSHEWARAGLSRYMRHSSTEYFVILKYRRIGAIAPSCARLSRLPVSPYHITRRPCEREGGRCSVGKATGTGTVPWNAPYWPVSIVGRGASPKKKSRGRRGAPVLHCDGRQRHARARPPQNDGLSMRYEP